MTISRSSTGKSLARPIGKIKSKPLKARSFYMPPGGSFMASGGRVPKKIHARRAHGRKA